MLKALVMTLIFLMTLQVGAQDRFLNLFKKPKPIIAALMIEGPLDSPEKVKKAIKWSQEQIQIAETAGMDGILFEFRGGKIMKPALSESSFQNMLTVSKAMVRSAKSLTVGLEILWHYPKETLRLAHLSGARFVRLDFFSDEVIADKKKVPINPKELMEYKKSIGAQKVVLLTDIQVKYSKMVDPKISLDTSAKKAFMSGSDGVIVSGSKSGSAPDYERPKRAKLGAGKRPVVIGSGFSTRNAKGLLKSADAAIVGTSISVKTGGPLILTKVKKLMAEVKKVRKKSAL